MVDFQVKRVLQRAGGYSNFTGKKNRNRCGIVLWPPHLYIEAGVLYAEYRSTRTPMLRPVGIAGNTAVIYDVQPRFKTIKTLR